MRGGAASNMSSTCVQGSHSRPLGGYQPNLFVEPHSPAPAWHQSQHPVIPKQEVVDEERNDSGLVSDCHSSSPGSENSQDYASQHSSVMKQNPGYYSAMMSSQLPPTPPFPPIHLPYPNPQQTTPVKNEDKHEDPLRRLQYALDTNTLVPHQQPQSPKNSEHSLDDDKSDIEGEMDERGLRIPRINSHGKVKKFRCKQCDFIAITKLDFWDHSKAHIKTEKRLTCPKCPFVTEYKHHLEYHLRNHFGSKPFKCSQCSYSCVNKSMLNSHLKSHSNIYQYRCSDCSYATKYCHSLKLHLRKYRHKPAMVLNPDGTPNPLPIIDVYGTRRGPKQKSMRKPAEDSGVSEMHNTFAHFLLNPPSSPMQLPFPYQLLAGLPNPMLFPQAILSNDVKTEEEPQQPQQSNDSPEALDLSKPTSPMDQRSKNRRKGPAFKLDHLQATESSEEDDETDEEKEPQKAQIGEESRNNNNNNITSDNFSCQYCNISFNDIILYTMHMGYHGYKNPFTCNMCGEQCEDKVSFFLHIARTPHS